MRLWAWSEIGAHDWQDTDRKAMSSYFQLFSFCFSCSGFALAWKYLLIVLYLYCRLANDPQLRPGCTSANAHWWTPFLEPGAFATSAGEKERGKGLASSSAGSFCALLVGMSPILFTCLEIGDEEDVLLASHIKLLMCISVLSLGQKEVMLYSLSSSLPLWLHSDFPSSPCFLFFFSVALVVMHCYTSLPTLSLNTVSSFLGEMGILISHLKSE